MRFGRLPALPRARLKAAEFLCGGETMRRRLPQLAKEVHLGRGACQTIMQEGTLALHAVSGPSDNCCMTRASVRHVELGHISS